MNRTMITATNTMTQLQKQMDVISNNIANTDTTGYKRKEAAFTDLLVQQYNNQSNADNEIGRLSPNGIRQANGAKLGQEQTVMTQGSIKTTSRTLDTALTTPGQLYRVLVTNDGVSEVQYTRDGAFYLSPVSDTEMMLVTNSGNPVLDENNNPIYLNGQATDYYITDKGSLLVDTGAGLQETANLGVSYVNKPQFLESRGGNLFGLPTNVNELGVTEEDILTNLTGGLRDDITIQQQALEQSNVDLSTEMTDLITAQRSYQFQARSITIADQMMGLINGIR